MLKTKTGNNDTIAIPARIAKKFALKDGAVIEARVEKGKLHILSKKDKIANIMPFSGIWENENVDEIFLKIRKDWNTWQKNLPV
ncbi:MAG: hypothetical protein NUV76_07735 [Candidatus Kuenenia sp.]|nr:hypothetical protein [Candidatus Kuenenia sp.]